MSRGQLKGIVPSIVKMRDRLANSKLVSEHSAGKGEVPFIAVEPSRAEATLTFHNVSHFLNRFFPLIFFSVAPNIRS